MLVALLVVVASILASRRKPRGTAAAARRRHHRPGCVQLEEHSRTAAAAAASTRWIRCHESFGANIKAVRSIPKASADATYGAILLIEPLRQFEALGAAVAVPLLEQYLRDLGRCAGGLVPVYGVTGDMKLARLVARGWAAPAFRWLDGHEEVPAAVKAVAKRDGAIVMVALYCGSPSKADGGERWRVEYQTCDGPESVLARMFAAFKAHGSHGQWPERNGPLEFSAVDRHTSRRRAPV